MSAVSEMTVEEYLRANGPGADPETMLRLSLAETERQRAKFQAREHEFNIASEIELDDNLDAKPKNLAQLFRIARTYVDAGVVPDSYLRDRDGYSPVAAVAIALRYARRCGVEDLAFLAASFPHKGKISIESKLAMAMLIKSGKIVGRPAYKIDRDAGGKPTACTCTVIDAETGEEKSQTVTWEMVTKEGWDKSKGTQTSKWMTLPELMFQYRSGVFVMRVSYPDVLMGMYTIEEMADIGVQVPEIPSLEELGLRMGVEASQQAPEPQNGHKTAPKARVRRPAATERPPAAKAPETPADEPDHPPRDQKPAAEAKPPESPKAPAGKQKADVPTVLNYMRQLYEGRCEGFDLEKIAADAVNSPNYAIFAKSVIEKTRPNWEAYVLDENSDPDEQISPGDDMPEETGGELVDENQEVPDCMANPVPRPPMPCHLMVVYENQIMEYKQAKRIEDYLTAKIKGHPELDAAEETYLMSLGQRRAYQLKLGIPYGELKRERQIPG